ncbi:L-rhamnose mutarotase [Maribacter forsetii]|uniref:L-rhamnose mutarotase n=1 Tax=Maribacter forsetii TaxID=444515 RepID=UPI0005641DD6|nr:L-rhamnose mutarotase [Maribacter forsetii]
MENQKHCFALDLKNDPTLIKEYVEYHKNVWPEITESIKNSHIENLDIYLVENRLFMVMETSPLFSFDKKQKADQNNDKVQEWETLMWKYQQAIPNSKSGEKWRLMNKIFEL